MSDLSKLSDQELEAEMKRRADERAKVAEAEKARLRTEKQKLAAKNLGLIEEKLRAVSQLFRQAEALADEAGVSFTFDLIYGMGGTYYPKKAKGETDSEDSDWSDSTEGWLASSQNC